MRAIQGVLKEELGRLLQLEKSYGREIRKLPRGSIQLKKIKGKAYAYLVFREAGEIVYEYLGKLSDAELGKLKSSIGERRRYENLRREVRRNIERLKRIVHGRKRSA